MTDMVTRVARALWDAAEVGEFDVQPDSTKSLYLHGARAAIEAMRVPTGSMLADGRDAIEPYVGHGLSKAVSNQWQIASETYTAMLDAALKSHEDKSALRGEEKAE